MTVRQALAYGACAAIVSVSVAGCAYETAYAGRDGIYAADDWYDGGFYDGFDGAGVLHDHRFRYDPRPVFHLGMRYTGGIGGFHSQAIGVAHAGGFGGHARG